MTPLFSSVSLSPKGSTSQTSLKMMWSRLIGHTVTGLGVKASFVGQGITLVT